MSSHASGLEVGNWGRLLIPKARLWAALIAAVVGSKFEFCNAQFLLYTQELIDSREGPLLSPQSPSTSTHFHSLSSFISSFCTLSPRAAGPAFEAYLHPAFVLSIRRSSTKSRAQSFTTSSARRRSRMPPKKKEEEKKLLLGRPGNSLKSGIVRTLQLPTYSPSDLLTLYHFQGRLSQRRQIDPLPSHHEVLLG